MVADGSKTIDVRLLDFKRSFLKPGDIILISDNDEEKCLIVRAKELSRTYGSFESFFRNVSPDNCGFKGMTSEEAAYVMNNIYTEEAVKKYGVIGIWLELLEGV